MSVASVEVCWSMVEAEKVEAEKGDSRGWIVAGAENLVMGQSCHGGDGGRLRQRRYLLVVVEIAMAGSEEDEGAGVVFVYVVMCMAVGNDCLWGGAGEVMDRFWWEAWFGQPWVVEFFLYVDESRL
ncbi:LOW QUALITY PROTEIN: hypothetical protein NC653_039502 [Populus alba x Populus x berolinensis]|uniref:Uncharacterized protein n=1 Tax=Populus alba x Populus x berolinensis TaxID=444605 RepID=A0AAD6LDX6_9ROSI|nr:LOW QUALITY PROTEIN: hypothetical protein NC653_039502 [Populus alba x Populus x berolinensis]